MPARANRHSREHLTRYAYESTGYLGWRVCVSRHGETFARYFSDRGHGGMRKAEDAAKRCLAKFLTKLDAAKVQVGKRKGSRRTIGVCAVNLESADGKTTRVVWVATWNEDGRRVVCKFSEAKYGARQAKQLATKARREADKRLGLNLVYSYSQEEAARLRAVLAAL